MNAAMLNLAWADAFVAALVAAGLRHCVLAPGARSAPLALAALRRPELHCHVINDERAAGYFALGLGKASGEPAALLCTSGTAAANLLPAVMEAHLAAVPLLLLTADRPAAPHGWGANQTVDQTKLYGDQVRAFHNVPAPTDALPAGYLRALAARLIETCRAPLPGPVHANLPFSEPLLPDAIPAPPPLPQPITLVAATAVLLAAADIEALAAQLSGRPGVIVCGEATYPPAFAAALAQLAARLDAPILAEALSNLRCGRHDKTHIFTHQARFLRQADLPAPAWVLRCGAFPVSRTLERWLASLTQAQQILIAAPGQWPDPLWQTDTLLRGDPLASVTALLPHCRTVSADFFAQWRAAEQAAACADSADDGPLFEGTVARLLLDAMPAGVQGFIGNSLAIRAVDAFCGTRDKALTLYGNRGASGIDGNIATAAGICAATQAPTALLIGDQAALHDCGSLALLAGRDIVAVVMDNGGGGIFDHLPFAQALPADIFRCGWTAPPQADFAALAAAFGLRYAQAGDAPTLRQALQAAFATGGGWLVRVVVDRASSVARFAA